jgi:hypothetical protein
VGKWTRTLRRRSCPASRWCPGVLSLVSSIRDIDIISWMRSGRLIAEMRGGVDEDTEPQELSSKQVVALHQLLHEAKFKDPDKDHLSPAGDLAPHQKSWIAVGSAPVNTPHCKHTCLLLAPMQTLMMDPFQVSAQASHVSRLLCVLQGSTICAWVF